MRNKEITNCLNCLYFDPVEDERGFVSIGLCKINAPDIRGFPRMRPQDGCGEGRLDENRIMSEPSEYEILNNQEYQEPDPYIRTNEILDEMFPQKTDDEVVSEILGQESEQEDEDELEKKN